VLHKRNFYEELYSNKTLVPVNTVYKVGQLSPKVAQTVA
jgi:hypothetical protein